jgi:starch-binding outer membrane protein, SusD/RagB family
MQANKKALNKIEIFGIIIFLSAISCNKLVQVPDPISSVTAAQVFSSDATATAAMLGIYSYMSSNASFSSYQATYYGGESADELKDESAGNEIYDAFLSNNLTAITNSTQVSNYFWQPAYYDIYNANALISGVQSSTGVSAATRSQLTGEAMFIRAFCYFYLTNLFEDIPLVLTPDFNQTVLLTRTPQRQIYRQIITDLLNAQNLMISDFSLSNGEPIRANKWGATALLARTYLYFGNWDSAYLEANAVINSGQFSLVSDPDSVFLANSPEAILQFKPVDNYPYATLEGNEFVPNSTQGTVTCWLTSQLLGAFEANDLRRADWLDSNTLGSVVYYYPYKYKIETGTSYPATENYMVLRLAEQYLIRAEAEANGAGGGPMAAIQDLDTIRQRAGLLGLSPSLSGDSLTSAVQQEWRIEYFAEWGHRWLDLKRWHIAIGTLDTIPYKVGKIDSTQLLYPIPISEMQTDPNLTQNPGYN